MCCGSASIKDEYTQGYVLSWSANMKASRPLLLALLLVFLVGVDLGYGALDHHDDHADHHNDHDQDHDVEHDQDHGEDFDKIDHRLDKLTSRHEDIRDRIHRGVDPDSISKARSIRAHVQKLEGMYSNQCHFISNSELLIWSTVRLLLHDTHVWEPMKRRSRIYEFRSYGCRAVYAFSSTILLQSSSLCLPSVYISHWKTRCSTSQCSVCCCLLPGSGCDDQHFQCGGTDPECQSYLFVCDGHKDCRNGADEAFCGKLQFS